MLRLKAISTHGTNHWLAIETPKEIRVLGSFWVTSIGGFISNPIENSYGISGVTVEGASIHGRSCFLGMDGDNNYYFAKGCGWNHSFGWKPSFGNLGILPLWAGEREKEISLVLKETSINVVKPIAIELHKKIPTFGSNTDNYKFIDAKSISDLDGNLANPCLYIYSSKSRWRLADLFYFSEYERHEILFKETSPIDWFINIIKSVSSSTGALHKMGGYDYSLSNHNIFIDGTRLDFEYLVLNTHPHPDKILNTDADTWRQKELYGLKTLAWELAELLRINIAVKEIDDILKSEYETASELSYPF
jgi:hypothetical protein